MTSPSRLVVRAKTRLKKRLSIAGWDIKKVRPLQDPWVVQRHLLWQVDQPTIFDVGASIGHTVKRYMGMHPEARIYAFEPVPSSFERLQRLAADCVNVTPVCQALSSSEGWGELHTNPDRPDSTSLLDRPYGSRRYYPRGAGLPQSIRVRVGTLDQFCNREGLDRIHLLKMDVQGGEGPVIEGATGMLSGGRIDAVYTEVMFVSHYADGKLFDEVSGMLARHGLRLFGLYNLTWATNGQLRFGDALYVSDGVRERVFNRLPEEP